MKDAKDIQQITLESKRDIDRMHLDEIDKRILYAANKGRSSIRFNKDDGPEYSVVRRHISDYIAAGYDIRFGGFFIFEYVTISWYKVIE